MEKITPSRGMPAQPVFVGAAYYQDPAQPGRAVEDDRLMQAAGFTVAHYGDLVLMWNLFEPEDGRFTLDGFVEQVTTLGQRGVKTFLATPTAAVPRWLHRQHPLAAHERGQDLVGDLLLESLLPVVRLGPWIPDLDSTVVTVYGKQQGGAHR